MTTSREQPPSIDDKRDNSMDELLEQILRREELPVVLNTMAKLIERQSDDEVLVSVLLLENGLLRHSAAPSLPDTYNQAVDGTPVDSSIGPCAAAVYNKEPVIVEDIANDLRWPDFKDLALRHGLRASWSVPLVSDDGTMFGIFAMYYRQPHVPQARDLDLIERLMRTASIAIGRKRSDEKLRHSEERYRESAERFNFMAESMPQKIFTAGPDGAVNYFNQQWTDFTGLSFQQIKDWGWTQFIHPDDVEDNIRVWRHSIETGLPFQLVHRFRRADGEYRWHLSRAHAMRNSDGSISMWMGSNTEIHEQEELKNQLAEQNRRQARIVSVLENSPDFIGMADAHTAIATYVNQAGLKIVGLEEKENLSTKVMLDFVALEARPMFERALNTVISKGYWEGEMTFRNWATDEPIAMYQRLWPVLNDEQAVIHYATIATTLTNPKRIEEVLGVLGQQKSLNEELQEALSDLQNVAFVVSHELQEPIRTIKSYQNLLAVRYRGRLGNDADEFIEKCATASSTTLRMVDDLWEYARINQRAEIKFVDSGRALGEAVDVLKVQIKESGTRLEYGHLPEVQANNQLLVNLFVRLLDNAIKYRRPGVEPHICINAESGGERAWLFTIQDNGSGIDPMTGKNVFNLFFRDQSRPGPDGTGMGLPIAKKIVEYFGGLLSFDSKPGIGSTFRFTMPRIATPPPLENRAGDK